MTHHLLIHAYGDADALGTALRVARNAAHDLPDDTRFHIVAQGPLVRSLTVGSDFTEELAAAHDSGGSTEVLACRNSMASANVAADHLLEGIGTIPSAAAYLAERQWEGWAYLRY